MWEVLTGRRDGRVSLQSEVSTNIPSPFQNFTGLKQFFETKGLTVHDLVVLSGIYFTFTYYGPVSYTGTKSGIQTWRSVI